MRTFLAAVWLLVGSLPAGANDTTAELGSGGLVFTRSDTISMESEDLYVSQDEVRVAYVFRNTGKADVEAIVAFPMPDIAASPDENVSIPDTASDNFLDFKVAVDGKSVLPELDQRAFAVEIDVTDTLRGKDVDLFPYRDGIESQLDRLGEADRQDWISRGIILVQAYDEGEGMKDHYAPAWTLKSTYWWRMTFPAGKPVEVHHSYKPSVGGTVDISFVQDGRLGGDSLERYRSTYCMDKAFESAAQKIAGRAGKGGPAYFENWLSYILTTGGNWRSSIGKFKLTIDKGKPENLVSFCGHNVQKTAPTTFVMTAEDFYPEDDLHILILEKTADGQ
jgi:Domain of unknown function (DUF4424)